MDSNVKLTHLPFIPICRKQSSCFFSPLKAIRWFQNEPKKIEQQDLLVLCWYLLKKKREKGPAGKSNLYHNPISRYLCVGISLNFCSSCFLLLPKHLIQSFKYSSVSFKNISSTFCFLPLSVSHDPVISEGKALPWYICISFHCVSKSFPSREGEKSPERLLMLIVTNHQFQKVCRHKTTTASNSLPCHFFRCHMPSEPWSPVSSRSWCDIL